MRKKLFIFCFLFIVALFSVFSAEALTKASILANISEKSETVRTVNIDLSENSEIAALNMEIVFNDKHFEFKGYTGGSLAKGGMLRVNTSKAGKIVFSFISAEGINKSGTLLSVDLKIKKVKDDREFPLEFIVSEAVNSQFEPVEVTVNRPSVLNPYYKDDSYKDGIKNQTDDSENPQEFVVSDEEVIDEIKKISKRDEISVYVLKNPKSFLEADKNIFDVYCKKGEELFRAPYKYENGKRKYDTENSDFVYIVREKKSANKTLNIVIIIIIFLLVIFSIIFILKNKNKIFNKIKKEGWKNE